MGGVSNVERLDPELRKRLIQLLDDPNITQQEIAELINREAGEAVVSKSSVNRYAIKMRQFSERNRQAREVAQAYLDKYGEGRQNALGKTVNEMLRMISFDLILELHEIQNSETDDPQERVTALAGVIHKISRGLKDLELAATSNAERERKLQDRLKQAADKIEKEVKAGGASEETARFVRREIMGIRD